jgi:phage/plasmid-like protein (TIGR03299 family)
MSHELEFVNGQAQMAYAGDVPWHGLGVKVPSDLTPEQMMKAAGLDWEVEKTPMFIRHNGDVVRVPKRYALTRTSDGKVLDIVGGDNWNPTQNVQAFEFFNDFISAGNCTMETAGSLHGGQIIWAMAKINEAIEVVKGDVIEGNLLFSNPHKYGKAIDIRSTDTRVVCNNTLTLALGEKAKTNYRVDHRQTFNAEEAKLAIGIAKDKLLKYKEMGQFLASKRFKEEDVVTYFNRVFKLENARTEEGQIGSRPARTAFESLWTQPGAEFGEGSFWQLFNAVTYATNHKIGHSADTRMQSTWFGSNADRNIQALNVAMEMAEAA